MLNDCNLQHYGIAGYYATMATDQGWYVFNMKPFQIVNHNLLLNSYFFNAVLVLLERMHVRRLLQLLELSL